MISSEFITGMLAGLAFWSALDCIGRWVGRRRKAKTEPQEFRLQPSSPPPKNPSSPWQWQAMPCGKRLELGVTGFYITLNPDQPDKIYQGFTPEHRRIVTGSDLAGMQRYIEGEAKERAEFEPKAAGWKP